MNKTKQVAHAVVPLEIVGNVVSAKNDVFASYLWVMCQIMDNPA